MFMRQVSLIRAMGKGPKAISEILDSASLIKVQNPRGAEWFQYWLEYLLGPYHSGGPRILLPVSPMWALLSLNQLCHGCIQVCLCSYIQSTQLKSLGCMLSLKWVRPLPATSSHRCRICYSKGHSNRMLAVPTPQVSGMQGL